MDVVLKLPPIRQIQIKHLVASAANTSMPSWSFPRIKKLFYTETTIPYMNLSGLKANRMDKKLCITQEDQEHKTWYECLRKLLPNTHAAAPIKDFSREVIEAYLRNGLLKAVRTNNISKFIAAQKSRGKNLSMTRFSFFSLRNLLGLVSDRR